MLYRHGDILIEHTDHIPPNAVKLNHLVIASSDTTGHRHRIKDRASAVLYSRRGENYLEVIKDSAELVHPEHDTIVLQRGVYRVWRQREFSEHGAHRIFD